MRFYFLAISLTFYSLGKFFLIPTLIIYFGVYCKKHKFKVSLYALVVSFFVLLFTIAFVVGVVKGNELSHILRNNFISLFFLIFIPYFFSSKSKDNFLFQLDMLVKVFSVVIFFQLILYISLFFSLWFDSDFIFVLSDYLSKIGYSTKLSYDSSLGGFKLFSNNSLLYLFLFGYGAISGRIKAKYLLPFLLFIIASSSAFQYLVLLIVFIGYIIKTIANRNTFSLLYYILIAVSMGGGVMFSPLGNVVIEKVSHLSDFSPSSNDTASIRIMQFRILGDEFESSPLFGKGLGYVSEIHKQYRISIAEPKIEASESVEYNNGKSSIKYQDSMYELQYMDILMKFGMFGAFVLTLYVFVPITLLLVYTLKNKHNSPEYGLLISFVGVVIFASSNGNVFYSYSNMIVFGIVLTYISRFLYVENINIEGNK
jgi:hypothetical protein